MAPTNMDDVIDSRDVEERIAELEAMRDDEDTGLDEVEAGELAALVKLREEAEGYTGGDWPHGSTLIRDSYFQKYAEELADDIGAIPQGLSWPLTCIDWEQAARELQQDYTQVEFDGVTYWVR